MKKQKNEKREIIRSFLKNPRGRAILFFLFYFFFFFLVISMIQSHSSERRMDKNENDSSKIKASYNLDLLEKENYRFTRKEYKGEKTSIFVGERTQDKVKLVVTKDQQAKNYFFYGDIVLEQENDKYKVSVNPYLYPSLSEYDIISTILDHATLKSKTTYESGESLYTYHMTTTTLVSIIDKKEVDLNDLINTIEVVVNDENEVTKIRYFLDDYHHFVSGENVSLKIEIDFRDYGKVEELKVPL